MLLEVFDLHHDLLGVFALLSAKDLELVTGVLLHEDVVLVENFDSRVNLHDFPSLQVLKVNLPLLSLIVCLIELGLEIGDLILGELFQS